MSLELRNPFGSEPQALLSNRAGLNGIEEGLGDALAIVAGDSSPLPTENPFNSSLPDAPTDSLDSFLTKEQRALKERMKEAEVIFNKETPEGEIKRHFFGPEQIKEAFGIELLLADVPEIPYTPDQLREAEKQGYELILRVAKDDHGNDMTAIHIYHLLKKRHGGGKNSWGETWMIDGEEAKILSQDPDMEWDPTDLVNEGKVDPRPLYIQTKEDFFYKDSLRFEWKLEARTLPPDSRSKNYVEQTRFLRETLRNQGILTSEEEAECSNDKLAELTVLMATDWREAAKQLANLKITQNHRRSFVEALYGQFMRQAIGGLDFKNVFVNQFIYEWTSSRDSNGGLLYFGCVYCDGARVNRDVPRYAEGRLRLLPVR